MLLCLELEVLLLELQFLHLHLDNRVLHLLLVLLLLNLLRIALSDLRTGLRRCNSDLVSHFRGHLLVLLFARQHANLLLHLTAVLQRNVLVDVRHGCGHDHLSLRVHLHELLNLRILYRGHVRLDVRLMVLLNERLDRLHRQQVLVLLHGVRGHHVVFNRHQLGGVLDAQHLDHLAVQQGQVVELRSSLSQLKCSLILHDLLRHRGCVRVADRDHLHHVVVRPLGLGSALFRLVAIVLGGVVGNDALEEFELLLHREVHPSLHSAHHLERTLQQRQSRAHRSLSGHVAHTHIASGRERPTLVDDAIKQRVQSLAWLLVGQRHDVVTHGAGGHIYVAELSRCDGGVISLDAEPTRFETTGEVRQSASVNKLADKHSRALGIAADEVDEAIAIETKPGNVLVMDEVLPLEVEFVAFIPIPTNRQHLAGALLNSDHIRQRDARGLTLLVLIFVTLEVQVNVHLQHPEALIVDGAHAHLFGFLLLDVV